MSATGSIRFFFDYVDPASYLLDAALRGTGRLPRQARLVHEPLEVTPPPRSLPGATEEPWKSLLDEMEAFADELGIPLVRPSFIPWSRKAHELALHAAEKGCFREVHGALFEAHFVEGRDIGRVDVLVEIASSAGLDRTETKTVLDVDRFLQSVRERRKEARRLDVVGVPTLLAGEHRLEGFGALAPLERFLDGISGAGGGASSGRTPKPG